MLFTLFVWSWRHRMVAYICNPHYVFILNLALKIHTFSKKLVPIVLFWHTEQSLTQCLWGLWHKWTLKDKFGSYRASFKTGMPALWTDCVTIPSKSIYKLVCIISVYYYSLDLQLIVDMRIFTSYFLRTFNSAVKHCLRNISCN